MISQTKSAIDRNDRWLLSRLDDLWEKYFSDIPQKNKVFISFGRFAKYRLGSIRLEKKTNSSIIITSMFKDSKISQSVKF